MASLFSIEEEDHHALSCLLQFSSTRSGYSDPRQERRQLLLSLSILFVEMLECALASCSIIEKDEEDQGIKVAIVGRPNVGKSTLINTLLDESRCVVSPVTGTTDAPRKTPAHLLYAAD